MNAGVVESVYEDYKYLKTSLAGDPSALFALEQTYPKSLLLAAASNLEVVTTATVLSLYDVFSVAEFKHFVANKALDRQFHALFDWKATNATRFFQFFGKDCKVRYTELMKSDPVFAACVRAFIEVGSLRNVLVHSDYANYSLDRTADDIYALYQTARPFPNHIKSIVYN